VLGSRKTVTVTEEDGAKLIISRHIHVPRAKSKMSQITFGDTSQPIYLTQILGIDILSLNLAHKRVKWE